MSLRVATSPVFRSLCARYTSTAAAAPTKRPLKPLLGRYDYLPEELFRINTSKNVVLRAYEEQMKLGRTSYDLHLHEDGLVHPKPGPMFEGPNGMSLRPDGPFLQELIRGFKGRNTIIYRLPQGIKLPPDLVLLHEHTDHHSMQCTVPMTLATLNEKLSAFCWEHGEELTKMEFVERYPFM
ncbi:hypothetical protein MSAN_01003200 [Mycena sanguinolenta]|uniref:Tse2 ADP-ribosyltransferase toxin domain-containing protein n=1 Tax=Mycena sanguinolenta TaxID=230812 RepID=A0A8H7D5X2_9AGAR|nr:hypothetical protein MSAN_01003200 [Mycena sanguinolenta]